MHRPELLEQARQTGGLNRQDEAFLKQARGNMFGTDEALSAKKL
jgi:hypothetical protein